MLDRFRLIFRLQVRGGAVEVAQGSPPRGFKTAVADIVRLHDIRHGFIDCRGQGRHARLRFSRDFPERGRQAIRNAWMPPTGPGSGSGRRASG